MKRLLFTLTVLGALLVKGQGIEFRDLTLDEAIQASGDEGKPIFIDCYTDWCGPCKWMSANMFTIDKIGDYYNQHFICIKLDMEKGEGVEFAKNHSIRAYPTLLYLDADQTELMRAVGASRKVEDYIEYGEISLNPEGNIPFLEANREQNMSSPEFMANYFRVNDIADQLNADVVNSFFNQYTQEDWVEDDMWAMIEKYVSDVNSPVFISMVENRESILENKGKEAEDFYERNIIRHLTMLRYAARKEENRPAYEKEFKKWLKTWPNDGLISFRMELLDAQLRKEWQEWRDIAFKGTEKYFWDDANQLNAIAWNFYESTEDPVRLKSALLWANRAVELNPEHHIIDTQAHLLDANGNAKAAVAAENRAIQRAKENGADYTDYQNYVDEIKSRDR